MKKEIICKQCGKTFFVKHWLLKQGRGIFCSTKCHGIWNSKNLIGAKATGFKNAKVVVKCKQCGKEFSTFKSITSANKGKFCSKKCFYLWNSINRVGEKSHSWKGDVLNKSCSICGKKYRTTSNQLSRSKTCSKECARKSISNCMKGDKTHLWRGGITKDNVAIRTSLEYRQWRENIFKRDDFSCTKCGFRGGILHAHHIVPFSKLLMDMKQNLPLLSLVEAARVYTPLWDTSNGRTVCGKCHKLEHPGGYNVNK